MAENNLCSLANEVRRHTHPDCREAAMAYAETVKKLEAARAAYNEVAPLTPEAAAGSRNWSWGCTPWPWEG